ncbi:MAG: hypothetical protein IKT57_07825 [Clostridia bacterium]|nr:hypothetical protein [Clostridia bacterium]
MKKRWMILLALMLALALPVQALAAPCRDQGMMEAVVNEPLQHMLNLVFSAVMAEDVTALAPGETPSAAMQEALFSLFYYVEGSSESSVNLAKADADMLYSMFFASGEADERFANGLSCDVSRFDQMPLAGAYVYESDVGEAENTLTLQCDLYTLWGYFSTPAQWVPEGDLTWWTGAEVVLQGDETSPYGYTLAGFTLTETYQDGQTADWQLVENADMEYSLYLPSVLGLCGDAPEKREYQTADGSAEVIITCLPGASYDEALQDFAALYPDAAITEERELFTFTAVTEGTYQICVAQENLPYVYRVDMRFPPERQQEYTLYGDLIRNSLAVWGLNNG